MIRKEGDGSMARRNATRSSIRSDGGTATKPSPRDEKKAKPKGRKRMRGTATLSESAASVIYFPNFAFCGHPPRVAPLGVLGSSRTKLFFRLFPPSPQPPTPKIHLSFSLSLPPRPVHPVTHRPSRPLGRTKKGPQPHTHARAPSSTDFYLHLPPTPLSFPSLTSLSCPRPRRRAAPARGSPAASPPAGSRAPRRRRPW